MSAFVAVTSHEAYLSAIATTWSRSLILNFLTLVLTAFPLWTIVILPQRPCSGRLGTVGIVSRSLGENTQRFSWFLCCRELLLQSILRSCWLGSHLGSGVLFSRLSSSPGLGRRSYLPRVRS